jgi:hypothetical protein
MKKILLSVMVLGLVVSLAIAGTKAFYTDNDVSTGQVLASESGTFEIEVNDNTTTDTFTFDLVKISNLAPGETTGVATIKVKNIGNVNAATFARFTLANDNGLSHKLNFYNYKVEYYNSNGTPAPRWGAPSYNDPYYGDYFYQDWFIRDGADSLWTAVGGTPVLYEWVNGNGPLDVPGTSWDMEALKPQEFYVLSFQFEMDPSAGNEYQGTHVTVGFEVKSTQIDTTAITGLGLGGSYNDSTYVGGNVTPYLQAQVL